MSYQDRFVNKLPLFPPVESLINELIEFFCYLLRSPLSLLSFQASPTTPPPLPASSTFSWTRLTAAPFSLRFSPVFPPSSTTSAPTRSSIRSSAPRLRPSTTPFSPPLSATTPLSRPPPSSTASSSSPKVTLPTPVHPRERASPHRAEPPGHAGRGAEQAALCGEQRVSAERRGPAVQIQCEWMRPAM